MNLPLPFQVARATGNNLASGFRQVKDENSIDEILSQSMQSNDPAVLQNNIGKILSQVSPERQGAAIQYLESAYNNIQQQKKQESQFRREEGAGLVPGLHPTAQAAIYKEKAKSGRLAPYGLGGNSTDPFNQPNAQNGTSPYLSGVSEQQQVQTPQNITQPNQSVFRRLSRDQLVAATGSPDKEISEPAKAELRAQEAEERERKADTRELRKETLPLRQLVIEQANAARESIRNKSHLIDLIDKGNINDPSFAIFAESLPFNLGKRMLSDDTVEYKGGLVDEFSDLKNIFKGATRVKEVEIYENKLADLYLDDSQKKAILKSRINASKIPIIREEAAAEVEEKYPNISALQFNKKVEELAKPKVNALFNSVWDEQKSVLDQAESRKGVPLDYDDPQDRQILDQILKEANGNRTRAREIAKKKGYKIGK